MSSLRLRLLRWLIGPILLVNLAAAALTYLLAWTPAQLAFDQGLSDAAGALAARLVTAAGQPALDLPFEAEQVLRADKTDAVYFVVRTAAGVVLAGDADFPALPVAPQAQDAQMRGEAVRVAMLGASSGAGALQIGVAKTLRKRQQVRAATIRTLLMLEGLFTLTLVGLIWLSVTNGLQPLVRMRANLNARDGGDLTPVDEAGVPYELAPVVAAFNDLLYKVGAGAQAQHDFLANVAHQLRTPLAGLKLQLEWLGQRHAADPATIHSLNLMLQSNERMIRQVNQLLALARAEPSSVAGIRREPLDLAVLVGQAVQLFVDQAARKDIDLGFNLQPTRVLGDAFLLRDLIDNLIDNAIRYTPPGGAVTVSCFAVGQHGILVVDDSGPGIPLARRDAVFKRFVRNDDQTSGSGLGLAIVQDVALAHGAELLLTGRSEGSGAVFSVRFPPCSQEE